MLSLHILLGPINLGHEGYNSRESCFATTELPRKAPYRDALVQDFLNVSAEVFDVDAVVRE